ncbi:MAG: hypothetical protein RIM99_06930 [Cyclobacteriaceae bacterium]
MKRSLLPLVLLVLISIVSCNKDNTVIQPDPPIITFPSGSAGEVERGATFSASVKLEAEAGIASLTVDGATVSNVSIGDVEQELTVELLSESSDLLGNVAYEFELTDQSGESTTETFTLTLSPGGVVQSDSVTVYDNVEVISDDVHLVSTDEQFESGTFVFESDQDLGLQVGDIIVGSQNSGYLRKVESVDINGNQVSLSTSQGTITDLFQNTQIDLDFEDLIENTGGRTNGETTFREEFVDLKLLEENESSMTVNGYVELDANYKLKLDVQEGVLQSISFNTTGTTLDLNLLTSIVVGDKVDVADREVEIFSTSKDFATVSPPVFGTVDFSIKAVISSSFDASITANSTTRDKVQIDFEALYSNGGWTNSFNSQELISEGNTDISGAINISNEIRLIPEIDIKLYGVVGPFFIPEVFATLDLGVTSPSLDWDAFTEVGYGGKFGLEAEIFGTDILRLEATIPEERLKVWEAPYSLEIADGNNQTFATNTRSDTLRVNVLDNLGNLVTGVPVHYEIIAGDGFLDDNKVFSNSAGTSKVTYTAGSQLGSGSVKTLIKNRNLEELDTKDFTFEISDQCADVDIGVSASLDANGAITVQATGGESPYEYSVDESAFQSSNIFDNGYEAGEYLILAKDANGCEGSDNLQLEAPLPGEGWYVGTYTLGHHGTETNSHHNCGTQYGQSGQMYVYVKNVNNKFFYIGYWKSIIGGLPNIFDEGLFSSFPVDRISFNWLDGTTGNSRNFSTGSLTYVEGSSIATDASFGQASMSQSGSNVEGCVNDYLFFYSTTFDLSYVGDTQPGGITSANLDIINMIIDDPALYSYIEE